MGAYINLTPEPVIKDLISGIEPKNDPVTK
jgi:hypothetical protein